MVTLCSSAQMKSLVRVRSYNLCRLRPACFWFTAAIMAAIVRQALSCPGQGLLFCQEHWIIFIALMGVWCEGEPTIRGVEITLLKWLPLPPIIKLAQTEASTLKDVTTAQPWTETRCHPCFGLSAGDDQQCLQLLPSLKSVSKPPLTCHHLQAVLVSFSQTGILQVCGFMAATFKESKCSRSIRSTTSRFLMQMRKEDSAFGEWRTAITVRFILTLELRYSAVITCEYEIFCKRRCRSMVHNYHTRYGSVTANALADKSSCDDVWRCVNLWDLDEIY